MMNYTEEFDNLFANLKEEVEAICDTTEQVKAKIELLKALGMAIGASSVPAIETAAPKRNSRKKKTDEGTAMHDALENKPAPIEEEVATPEPVAPESEEAPVAEKEEEPLPELPAVPEDVVRDTIAEEAQETRVVEEPTVNEEPSPVEEPVTEAPPVLTADMVSGEWNDAMKTLFAPTIAEIQEFVNRLIVPAKNKEKAYGFFSKVAATATNNEVTVWKEYTDVPPIQIKNFLAQLKADFAAMCAARRKA